MGECHPSLSLHHLSTVGGAFKVYSGSDSKFQGFRHEAAGFGAVVETPSNQELQPHSRQVLYLTVTPEGNGGCHILLGQALSQGNWTN